MKQLSLILCFVGAVFGANATASDDFAEAVQGSYLLLQEDGFKRILSFYRGGNVISVSDQQADYGFTSGQGAWKRIGESEVTATVIDFSHSTESGSPLGSSLIVYMLTLSDKEARETEDGDRVQEFQSVTGAYSGKQFAFGQNPIAPTERPIREFGIGFTGQRISAQ